MGANLDVPSLESGIQLEKRSQILAGASGDTEEAARPLREARAALERRGRASGSLLTPWAPILCSVPAEAARGGVVMLLPCAEAS